MPENYGQGYGGYPQGDYPQQQQQPMQEQQPYGYGQQPPMGVPAGGDPYGGYPGGQPPKKGLGIGAIIGIVVGVLALIGVLGFYVLMPNLVRGGGGSDDTTTATKRNEDDKDEKGTGSKDSPTGDETQTKPDDEGGTSGNGADPTTTTGTPSSAANGSSGAQSGATVDINNLADDWTLGEVNLAGRGYRLFESTYGDLVAGGWMLDKYDMEKINNNGGALVINAGEWLSFTFTNVSFPDASLTVGLGNMGNAPINYDQGTVTYLAAHAPYSNGGPAYDKCYDFVLSKGAKLGMTDTEILALFGQPDDNGNIYESDDGSYKSLTYTVVGSGETFDRNYYRLEFQFVPGGDGSYHAKDITIGV